jgi:TolA-binding protein
MKRFLPAIAATIALATLASWVSAPAAAQEKPAEAKSSPEALQLYRDAANFQNNKAFELAVEEWQKFLKDHPKDPLAAKAQHYLGVCQLQLKQVEAAVASFEAVIKNHPKFELLEDTYLNLASSQYALAASGKAESYAKASETFAALIKDYPKGKYVEESLFYQGESLYAQGRKEEAIASYDRLVKEFEKSKRRADTLYALGVTQEEIGKHADAGKTYDIFLKDFASSPLATEVRMRKAETVLQAGDVAGAAKMFGEVAAVKDFASADHALYRQGFCQAKLDKYPEAAALYAKVASDFPKSAYVADSTISAGRCFYRADKPAEASAWLQKAVDAKDANSPEAAHWLCRILIKTGKAAEAADLASKQLAAGGDSAFVANLQLDQADALYEIPDMRAESLALYAKFSTDNPKHELAAQSLYNAAFTALELKQYDEGLKHATAFLTAFPQDKLLPDVKYVAAECNLQLKKHPEAEALYKDLTTNHAGHADVDAWRVRLGLVAYLQKKYAEAIAALSPIAAMLKAADAKAEAQFLIGASHFYTDKFAEAESALKASLMANAKWRQSDEAFLLIARSQVKTGKTDAAKTNLGRLLTDYPETSLADQAHYRLGEIAYAADDHKAAIAEHDIVITKFAESPFAPFAMYSKGWSLLKSKQFPQGDESFTALLTKYPEHQLAAEAQLGRAMCRRQAGDPKGAIADLDEYLKSNPDQVKKSDAFYERGLAQVAAGDFAGAITTLDGLLKADAKYAAADKVLYEIGWAHKSQEKHAEAVPIFAKLVAEHPDSPLAAEASFHVGEDQYDKKQYAEAAKSYTAVKAKTPGGELGEKATYKLGWSHFQQKQYAEALKEFSEQVAAFPQGPLAADAIFMKAECLFREEEYKEAWPAYQAALKTKASTPAIEALTLLHGGQSAAQLKLWDESLKLLSAIPEKFPETPLLAEALYESGWAEQNLGQNTEALKSYEAAATKSRDHVGARARFMMGELHFAAKKHDEAVREFQRAMFGFGGEQATPETKNWQAKSGYEAGRCAEVQVTEAKDAAAKQKAIADAKRMYTFVVEKHAGHELAGEAKKRLDVLAKL